MAEEEELDAQSAFWLAAWISTLLIFLTVLYDVLGEKLTACLKRQAGIGEDEVEGGIAKQNLHAAFLLKLWLRFRAEVTTLGFLAFTVYICSELHLFRAVVDAAEEIHPPESTGAEEVEEGVDEPGRRMLSIAVTVVPGQHLVRTVRRFLQDDMNPGVIYYGPFPEDSLGEEGGGSGEEGGSKGANDCYRYMSASKDWLKEHVEAVHYSFFIAMCLYFLLIAIAITVHNCRFPGPRRSHGHGSNSAHERRAHYLLRHGRSWPAVQQLAAAEPEVALLLAKGRLNYPSYVQCASADILDVLVEFPATTWLVALGYQIGLALLSGNACVDDHWLHLVFQIASCAAWLYLSLRVLVFFAVLGAGGENGWPLSGLDRYLTFWIGPGFVGFFPLSELPSARLALSIQQSWVWFHLQRLAFLVSNENGSLYDGEPHPGIVTDLVVTACALLLSSLVVWPFYIEMCVHMPMASRNVPRLEQHLCRVLQHMAASGDQGEGAPQKPFYRHASTKAAIAPLPVEMAADTPYAQPYAQPYAPQPYASAVPPAAEPAANDNAEWWVLNELPLADRFRSFLHHLREPEAPGRELPAAGGVRSRTSMHAPADW